MDSIGLGLLSYFRGTDIWIRPRDLRSLASAAALTIKVPDLSRTQAARAARAANHFSGVTHRITLIGDRPRRDDTHVAFSVTRLVKEPGRKAEYLAFDRVDWDAKDGWSSDKSTQEALDFIIYAQRWQTHLDYAWVRNLAMNGLSQAKAFPLPGGGVFYVHADQIQMKTFRTWKDFIDQIPGARLLSMQIDGGDEETRRAISEAAQEDLGSVIRRTVEDLKAWRDKSHGQRGTVLKMLGEIAETRARAVALAGALGFQVETIQAELDGVQTLLDAALDERDDTDAKPRTEKQTSAPTHKATVLDTVVQAFQAFQANGKDEVSVPELTAYCEEHGLLAQTKNTKVRTMISGRISDAREAGDKRFERVRRGVYRYHPEGAPTAPAPSEPDPSGLDEAPTELYCDDEPHSGEPLPADDDGLELEWDADLTGEGTYGDVRDFDIEPEPELDDDEVIGSIAGGDSDWFDAEQWKAIPADLERCEDWQVRCIAKANGMPDTGDIDLIIDRLLDLRETQAA